MKTYFGYIRVSTAKQGEHGASLPEQRDAIVAFAARNGLHVATWFEERETAAKTGRREFTHMLSALRSGKAAGVIFHKIDRSARNLRDWSAIQDLADEGIDVRFAQESVNLGSNEGKLTGDFLAVISAHYIRNLREEVKKGIRGRLKQGLFPLPAPIGYLNQGGGKPKVPDPERAPFVRQAFELYASGAFPLHRLAAELHTRGFRGRTGNRVGVNRLAELLRNAFYCGVIRLKRSSESFPGVHEPIVSVDLYKRVQLALDGKANTKAAGHDFLFRRMISCAACGYSLIGERQKGNVYYRCHNCTGCCVREEVVELPLTVHLKHLRLTDAEVVELDAMASSMTIDWVKEREQELRSVTLTLENDRQRLERLTNLYIDGGIERTLFDAKRLELLMEQKRLEEQLTSNLTGECPSHRKLGDYLELVKTLSLSYEKGTVAEKRELLKTITSNLTLDRKNVVIELNSPFRELSGLEPVLTSGPVRDRPRTKAQKVFDALVANFTASSADISCRHMPAVPGSF